MTNDICECGHPLFSHHKDDQGEEYCHDCGKDTSGGMGSSYHQFKRKESDVMQPEIRVQPSPEPVKAEVGAMNCKEWWDTIGQEFYNNHSAFDTANEAWKYAKRNASQSPKIFCFGCGEQLESTFTPDNKWVARLCRKCSPNVEEPKESFEAQDNKAFLDIVKTNPSLTLSIPAQNLVRLGWLAALQYKRGRNK